MTKKILTLIMLTSAALANVPLKDNLLFGFEKCKILTVDLQKGQLIEASAPGFDVVCKKKTDLEFSCDYFDTGSSRVLKTETFKGGSDLGAGELTSAAGDKLRFLIGKTYAAFEAGPEKKVCVGIYLFEQDALKKTR